MLHDGWKYAPFSTPPWNKGGRTVEDPYWDFLAPLVYGDELNESPYLWESIFSGDYWELDLLIAKIGEDLDIDFEEDCPCLTATGHCDPKACSCRVGSGGEDEQRQP